MSRFAFEAIVSGAGAARRKLSLSPGMFKKNLCTTFWPKTSQERAKLAPASFGASSLGAPLWGSDSEAGPLASVRSRKLSWLSLGLELSNFKPGSTQRAPKACKSQATSWSCLRDSFHSLLFFPSAPLSRPGLGSGSTLGAAGREGWCPVLLQTSPVCSNSEPYRRRRLQCGPPRLCWKAV